MPKLDMALECFLLELNQERQDRGLSLRAVAATAQVSVSALHQYERGEKTPPDPKLHAWAAALNMPVPDGVVGLQPRPAAVCGTNGGYLRHKRLSEPIDEACRVAHNQTLADWRAGRRGDPSDDPPPDRKGDRSP